MSSVINVPANVAKENEISQSLASIDQKDANIEQICLPVLPMPAEQWTTMGGPFG